MQIIYNFYYKLLLVLQLRFFIFLKSLKIKTSRETVRHIITNRVSVSRYGDGEFSVMAGGCNGFQKDNPKLASKLKEVISIPIDNHIVCIPSFLKSQKGLKKDSKYFILGLLASSGTKLVEPFISKHRLYYDSYFTRFYMPYAYHEDLDSFLELLKQIWDKKDLLIVEGRYSRLGVNNDLFDNATSIQRILCPEKNAFDKYETILAETKQNAEGKLVLIALGMTATVLAYDLAKVGVQAIDIGHVDVEYMWYKIKATQKCPIPGRYVNEAGGYQEELDESLLAEYKQQIIKEIQ